MHYCSNKGFTLIEILISITLSTIIFSILITVYLTSLHCYQNQHALMKIQTNGARANQYLVTNPIQQFSIKKTKRHHVDGSAIYSLYLQNKEIIDGVNALHYQITELGVVIELILHSPPITTKWYVYAPII